MTALDDPFESINWSEIRAEIAAETTIEPIGVGDIVTIQGHWPYLDRAPQHGTVSRLYERRSRFAGTTPMARVHWQDGSYSAVERGRLVAAEPER